jgi:hypothetical protein
VVEAGPVDHVVEGRGLRGTRAAGGACEAARGKGNSRLTAFEAASWLWYFGLFLGIRQC